MAQFLLCSPMSRTALKPIGARPRSSRWTVMENRSKGLSTLSCSKNVPSHEPEERHDAAADERRQRETFRPGSTKLLAWSAAKALEGVEVSTGGVPWGFAPSVSI